MFKIIVLIMFGLNILLSTYRFLPKVQSKLIEKWKSADIAYELKISNLRSFYVNILWFILFLIFM